MNGRRNPSERPRRRRAPPLAQGVQLAVHETEAWLLSDPGIFPAEGRRAFPDRCRRPETVNFDEPEVAYERCPSLKALLDDMLALAQEAGR